MINVQQISEFNKAIPIIMEIEKAGYEAYFVGGGVRDTLLHLPISDVDIATSATPDEIQRIFSHHFLTLVFNMGPSWYSMNGKHMRLQRFERNRSMKKFRRPESVEYVRSLEEDLKRRDFTINAIALDRHGNVNDPFNGQEDIEARLVRAVGNPIERFREDALRMMRAARFMSQLGFDIDEETKEAVYDYHPLLSKIAVERVRDEWTKLLMGRNRKGGIKFFVETRLFHMCPGFQSRDKELVDVALFPLQFQTPLTAWTILVHFLGVSEKELDPFLRAWKLSNKQIQEVKKAVHALHIRMERFWDYPLLFETGIKIALEVEEMITGFGMINDVNRLLSMDKTIPIHSTRDIKVDGKDVMKLLGFHRGGPYLGKILSDIKDRILAETLTNDVTEITDFISKRRFIYLDEIHKKTFKVETEHTAVHVGSGDLEVLGTPVLIAFMENTCKEMMSEALEEGKTSVGTFISIKHSQPTAVGAKVTVEARVKELKRNRLTFSVLAREEEQIVAIGEHKRVVVDIETFMNNVTRKDEEL